MLDPNPKIEYQGIELIENAGIDVRYGVLKDKIRTLNMAFIEKHKKHRTFDLVEGVITGNVWDSPDAVRILEKHLQNARTERDLKYGDVDHYKEIVSYEDFLGLINHFEPSEMTSIIRAFLFSLEKQDGLWYRSDFHLHYTFHTTQIGATTIGLGSDDPREVITALWHDLKEDKCAPEDEILKELARYGFPDEVSREMWGDLTLLDRNEYIGPYHESTKEYYRGLLSSSRALKVKSADMMLNMKRWLMHHDYLIREKPHLIGKYFYESGSFLNEEVLNGIIPEVAYRLGRVKKLLVENFDDQARETIIQASERFGKEVRDYVSEIVYI